jgi:hypothetical protein
MRNPSNEEGDCSRERKTDDGHPHHQQTDIGYAGIPAIR